MYSQRLNLMQGFYFGIINEMDEIAKSNIANDSFHA
jgi:hypothetical protein